MALARLASSGDATNLPDMPPLITEDKAAVAETADAEKLGETSKAPKAHLKVAPASSNILATLPQTRYVSSNEVIARRARVPNDVPTRLEDDINELIDKFSASIGLSPSPPNTTPGRIPVIRVHFMRHAQAGNNVRNLLEGYGRRNPPLTQVGREQCEVVCRTFPNMEKITHIMCSPLTRTIETALTCFRPLYAKRDMKATVWPALIEFGDGPTNRGDSFAELTSKLEGLPMNLGYLSEGWENLPTHYQDKKMRVKMVGQILHTLCQVAMRSGEDPAARLDVDLVIISHGAFLRQLIRGHPRFENCQVRTCEFATSQQIEQGAAEYHLFETTERKNRVYQFDWDGLAVNDEDLAEEDAE